MAPKKAAAPKKKAAPAPATSAAAAAAKEIDTSAGPPFPDDLFGADAPQCLKDLIKMANEAPEPVPIPEPEPDPDPLAIEKYRLATRETVIMGRSAKSALVKFSIFAEACKQAGEGAADDANVQRLKDQAIRELRLFSVDVRKQKLAVRAAERDRATCAKLEEETAAKVSAAESNIERLQESLKEAREERARKEEYESLAKIINQYPSQAESRAEIDRLNADIAALEARKAKVDKVYNEKAVRISLVLQLLDDLERSELEEALATKLEDDRNAEAAEVDVEMAPADADAAGAPALAAQPMDEDDDGEIMEDAPPTKRSRK